MHPMATSRRQSRFDQRARVPPPLATGSLPHLHTTCHTHLIHHATTPCRRTYAIIHQFRGARPTSSTCLVLAPRLPHNSQVTLTLPGPDPPRSRAVAMRPGLQTCPIRGKDGPCPRRRLQSTWPNRKCRLIAGLAEQNVGTVASVARRRALPRSMRLRLAAIAHRTRMVRRGSRLRLCKKLGGDRGIV